MKINDNNETVTCRICGEQCKRIYGKHLKFAHNDMTTMEYKKLFPGAPIMALSDVGKTTINSGKHMKEERYKKMFSEKIKGDKNPMWGKNHSEETKKVQSDANKGISPANKGKKIGPYSAERRKKMSAGQIGRVLSTDTKEKIRQARLKYWASR